MKQLMPMLIILSVLLQGCQAVQVDPTVKPLAVKVVAVKQDTLDEILELNGIVNPLPNSSARISATNAGVLTYVGPKVGDRVAVGELVARTQRGVQSAQVGQAVAALELANANLEKAKVGARPEEILQARAALDVASANLGNAKATKQRFEQLYKEDIAPGQALDLAVSQEKVASAQQAAAIANLTLVKKGLRREDRLAAAAQSSQARANVELARAALQLSELRSPIEGFVIERYLNIGDQTGPTNPIMLIAELNTVMVQANLPVGYNRRIEIEDRVQIVSPGLHRVCSGTVMAVGMKVDPVTNTIPIQIRVQNNGLALKMGMVVRCRIVLSTHRNVTVIPKNCLIASAEDPSSFVVNLIIDNHSEPAQVKTDIISGDVVEITSGLKPGQLVINDIGYELPDKTPVTFK
jgi:multidrug efflux pump subunit AcrA (membrane-fusion protein)